MAVTDIAPTTLSLVVGVNVTLKVALWPGAKLNGRPRPLNRNSLPLTQTCEIVRFVPLELVNESEGMGSNASQNFTLTVH
jgi:hypothetical protein